MVTAFSLPTGWPQAHSAVFLPFDQLVTAFCISLQYDNLLQRSAFLCRMTNMSHSTVCVYSVTNLSQCFVVLRRVTTRSLRSGSHCRVTTSSQCSVFLHMVDIWSDLCVSLLGKELIAVFNFSLQNGHLNKVFCFLF